ncbi:MAG: ABC transporter ATP-binding protein [Planctomycetes bacterium]|nr:ABC transporter ATP-binding protein [Planctomycetota bacterium]
MIRVEGLRAGYPTGFRRVWREILAGVSFDVPKGSITGYLGINGAGKTTTIKVLVGINPPSGGTATIGGHPTGSSEAQRLLGYFPEAPFFYDSLSGRELLHFYARLAGMERADRRSKADHLLDEVGLGEAKDIPVKGYSKGMRQRLGLAQALIADPQVLILDEPLDGLDPMGRLHLRNLIERQRDAGRTVFFSSHVLSDVETVSDHLVILDGGVVAYSGTTDGVSGNEERVDVVVEAPIELLGVLKEACGVELSQKAAPSDSRCRYEALCPEPASAERLVRATLEGEGTLVAYTQRRASLEEAFLERFGTKPASPAETSDPGVPSPTETSDPGVPSPTEAGS